MANLGPPNKRISDAVDVRSELDLRIGNGEVFRSRFYHRSKWFHHKLFS